MRKNPKVFLYIPFALAHPEKYKKENAPTESGGDR